MRRFMISIDDGSMGEVETHQEALEWAAKIAKGCRCNQEVREIMYDPES